MAPLPNSDDSFFLHVGIGFLVTIGTFVSIIWIKSKRRDKKFRKEWNNVGKNVVVLHQFPRSFTCPSPSPFPVKLETFLRVAGIEYINDFEKPIGPKGLTPWITINGEDIADSQLAIEFLEKKLEKSLDSHIPSEDQPLARALRIMLEERTRWCIGLDKWIYHGRQHVHDWFPLNYVPFRFLRSIVFWIISRKVEKSTYFHGLGRHSREEVEKLGLEDLRVVSQLLGRRNTSYLFGNSPSVADCSLFGLIVTARHCTHPSSQFGKLVTEDKSLSAFYDRMKRNFWPDWPVCQNSAQA